MQELLERTRSYRKTLHKIESAEQKRQELLRKGKLSLPSDEGKLVIVVSGRAANADAHSPQKIKAQHDARLVEARQLADERRPLHKDVVIRERAVPADLRFDFADRTVSDIVMIGHGTLNSIWADDGGYFTWQDVAHRTDYLKQGVFEQRTCGHLPMEMGLCVPLGTFAVADALDVRAALGEWVPLPDGSSRAHLFHPVYTDNETVVDQIVAINDTVPRVPKHELANHTD